MLWLAEGRKEKTLPKPYKLENASHEENKSIEWRMHHLKVTQSTIKTAITYSVCICKYCIKQNGAVKPVESVWNKIK